jgi:SAM-dependent methyltransferase
MNTPLPALLFLSLAMACEGPPPATPTQVTQPTPAHAAPPPAKGPRPAPASPDATGLQRQAQLVDHHHIEGMAAVGRYLDDGDTAELRHASEAFLQAIPSDSRPGTDRRGRSPERLLRTQKSLMFYAWAMDQLGDPGPRQWLEAEAILSAEAFDFFFESRRLEEVLGWVMLLDCQDNLEAIGDALAAWAVQHDGRYPEQLDALVPDHLPRLPTCASTGACTYCDGYRTEHDGQGFQLVCDQHSEPAGPPLAIAAGQHGGAPMDPALEQQFKIYTMLTGGYTDTHRVDQHLPHLVAGAAMGPGDVVADVGAGPGLFTLPFAEQVGPAGRVWAVDINASVLSYVDFRAQRRDLPISTVLAIKTDCGLEDQSLDSALVIQTYHAMLDLQRPGDVANYERKVKPWLESILQALRPGGRLVVQDTDLPAEIIKRQVGEAGFEFVEQKRLQGQDLLLVFARPE